MTKHDKRFENSFISALCFLGCSVSFATQGWIIPAGLFGLASGGMLIVSIYHVAMDIWEA